MIVDSTDFSESVIYDGVMYSDFDLPQINEAGIEGQYRIAFYLSDKTGLKQFNNANFDFDEYDFFQWMNSDEIPPESVYQAEIHGRPLLWREYPGGYNHEIYFPNRFDLLYQLDDDTYLIAEAHSYGYYEVYSMRVQLMNILATFETLDES